MGSFDQLPFSNITNANFSIFTNEDVKKLSVVEITKPISTNSLGSYLDNGIYDLRLGKNVIVSFI